jgi:mannose-6-phosphate isomerase-like protein (cupin superfamily)
MHVRSDEASAFEIPGGTVGAIYPSSPRGDQTIARVSMDGVYPEKGWSINSVCTETIFLLEGEFELTVGDQKIILRPNDLYMILPGNKYQIRGKGTALDLMTPAWDKNQNKIIEE